MTQKQLNSLEKILKQNLKRKLLIKSNKNKKNKKK